MLKRAQRLAQEQARSASSSEKPASRRASVADFSLKESPLTRALAWNVGRGQAASDMQRISHAAVLESGVKNVHKRTSVANRFKVWPSSTVLVEDSVSVVLILVVISEPS